MWRSVSACVCALSLFFAPSASADMRGVDVSNWQCDIDTGAVDADFIVAGATWGIGGFNNTCLVNGVNQAANYQLGRATNSGKSIGVYHYAMGRDANAEADFFIDNVRGYVGNAVLVLDWESQDNPQFGNGAWIETWVRHVHDRTQVWPIVYVQASALGQLTSFVREHCGVWVAQYASMAVTGYQETPWLYGAYGEAMRQYTSNGYVSGYAGRLDLNYFRGERWQWDAYAHGDGANVSASGTNTGGNVVRSACVVVTSGDTLSGIAERTGLLPWQLWHGYASGNPAVIYPGETVCYGGAVAARSNVARTHVVASGESLWSIFGGDWARVASLNGLSNPNLIYPGQILRY
jgi:GH25 family lysozyme M1 (1,4-beta-N-acetylmuramidase)